MATKILAGVILVPGVQTGKCTKPFVATVAKTAGYLFDPPVVNLFSAAIVLKKIMPAPVLEGLILTVEIVTGLKTVNSSMLSMPSLIKF